MTDRKQKIEELLENFHSLKRMIVFNSPPAINMPRITPSQFGVLLFIEQHGESMVKDLAKMLGITSSATTQLVDGLVLNGYLVRKTQKNDRRVVVLSLSKKSKTVANKMKREVQKKFTKFFEVLSDKEFNQYVFLNKKIVAGLLINKNI